MVFTCFMCKWRSDQYPRRSYHKFPGQNDLKQKWLDIIGKSNANIGTRTSLCCLHFEEDCFRYGLVRGRKILKSGSLPTLLLTKGSTEDQIVDSVKDIKIPKSPMVNKLHTVYPLKDEVKMKDVTLEVKVENNFMEISIKTCSSSESRKSSSSPLVDERPGQDEVLRLKRKVVKLKRLVKHLKKSNRIIRSELTELRNRACKLNAENKLTHVVENESNSSLMENNVMINIKPVYEESVQSSAKPLPVICVDGVFKMESIDDAEIKEEESEFHFDYPIKQELASPLFIDNRELYDESSIKKEPEEDDVQINQQSVTFYDVEITGIVSDCSQITSNNSEQNYAPFEHFSGHTNCKQDNNLTGKRTSSCEKLNCLIKQSKK